MSDTPKPQLLEFEFNKAGETEFARAQRYQREIWRLNERSVEDRQALQELERNAEAWKKQYIDEWAAHKQTQKQITLLEAKLKEHEDQGLAVYGNKVSLLHGRVSDLEEQLKEERERAKSILEIIEQWCAAGNVENAPQLQDKLEKYNSTKGEA